MDMIACERQNEVIEWLDLKNAIQMLLALGIDSRVYYEEQFENLFLEYTAEFYKNESQLFLGQNSASQYIKKVNECLVEENARAERYLDKTTEAKVITVVREQLIEAHMEAVIGMANSGITFMLTNEKFDDLKSMFKLFSQVKDGVKVMTEHMSVYLRQRGQNLVEDNQNSPVEQNPVQFIQNLLDLKDLFDKFLTQSFDHNDTFKRKIQSDFAHFFNLNAKSPEYLSLYIDDKLRKGVREMNDADIEQVLDKAMVLFKYLQEKDMFERYYKQHLCRRLLLGRSQSDDTERAMIGKLRVSCCLCLVVVFRLNADVNSPQNSRECLKICLFPSTSLPITMLTSANRNRQAHLASLTSTSLSASSPRSTGLLTTLKPVKYLHLSKPLLSLSLLSTLESTTAGRLP